MTAFKWSLRSKNELTDIHTDLRKVVDRALALSPYDFIIVDGRRTIGEQMKHVKAGASKTMKSRHLHGYAIDYVALVGKKARYELVYMKGIADAFKQAAKELKIPINWGGDWKSFKDTPHIELDKKRYPDP